MIQCAVTSVSAACCLSRTQQEKRRKANHNNPRLFPIGSKLLHMVHKDLRISCSRGFIYPLLQGKPAARWTDSGFFSSTKWQPCSRQPGSPVCLCVCAGDGELRSLSPPGCTPSALRCFGCTSCLVLVTGKHTRGLEKAKGVAIETLRFPHIARVAHLTQWMAVSHHPATLTHSHPGAPPDHYFPTYFYRINIHLSGRRTNPIYLER